MDHAIAELFRAPHRGVPFVLVLARSPVLVGILAFGFEAGATDRLLGFDQAVPESPEEEPGRTEGLLPAPAVGRGEAIDEDRLIA